MKRFFQEAPVGLVARMLLICLLVGCVLLLPGLVQLARAASAGSVTVDANSSLGTIPSTAFGVNEAAWNAIVRDPATPSRLAAAGAKIMRWPGGSLSDAYHWQSHTFDAGWADSNNTFDAFMQVAQQAGTQPMITVNYGSGTPQEAAGWVQYANKGGPGYSGPVPTYAGGSSTGHTYGIKYWEIGNEVFGNGTYGANWENDTHALGPATYANNVVAFSQAMKAVDPSIKTGLVVTGPGQWPDGQTSSSSPQPWNNTVLPIACPSVDFVIVHWYPYGATEADKLATANLIPSMLSTLRSELNQYCGPRGNSIQIMITETNAGSLSPGQRATAWYVGLFLSDMYMTMLENGAVNIDWWLTHDDLLSSGAGGDPPAQTPFPPYYALQMLTNDVGQPGDTMVSSSSSQFLVATHAVKQANGNLALLLINRDPTNSYTVSLGLNGYSANATTTVYTYGTSGGGITSTSGSASSVTIAPYSLTTVVFHPGSGGSTPTPTPTPSPTPIPGITPTPTPGTGYGACSVHYAMSGQWSGGFGANITITDTGPTTINGWVLRFAFPSGQQVTQGWSGVFTQAGANVTVTNANYNGTLAAGASTSLGFNGSWSGSNLNPTAFTLNGVSCAVV